MTILIAFHQSGYRTFKHFYQKHVCVYWRAEFPMPAVYPHYQEGMTTGEKSNGRYKGICALFCF